MDWTGKSSSGGKSKEARERREGRKASEVLGRVGEATVGRSCCICADGQETACVCCVYEERRCNESILILKEAGTSLVLALCYLPYLGRGMYGRQAGGQASLEKAGTASTDRDEVGGEGRHFPDRYLT